MVSLATLLVIYAQVTDPPESQRIIICPLGSMLQRIFLFKEYAYDYGRGKEPETILQGGRQEKRRQAESVSGNYSI